MENYFFLVLFLAFTCLVTSPAFGTLLPSTPRQDEQGWGYFSRNCDYCKLSPVNTYCLYGENERPSDRCIDVYQQGLTNPDEIQHILDLHNNYRRKVAMGQERRLQGGRPASNMKALIWSDELATGAQLWANQCSFEHDKRDICGERVGQNLYITAVWGMPMNTSGDWDYIIGKWYDEVDYWGSDSISSYSFDYQTGHFSQIIWADTYMMGCGYMAFDGFPFSDNPNFSSKFYICNYAGIGNRHGEAVYQVGQPCSRCPEGWGCHDSLCGLWF